MLSWEITSQLLLLVMSSLEEMCLLTASALLSVGAAAGHGGTHHWSDCSSLGKQAEFSNIFGSTQTCVLKGAGFSGGSWLPALWICEPCKEQELHGLHSPGLTDRQILVAVSRSEGEMDVSAVSASVCLPVCANLSIQISLKAMLYKQYNAILWGQPFIRSLCAAISESFKYQHCVQYESDQKKPAVIQASAFYSSWVTGSYSEPHWTINTQFNVIFWSFWSFLPELKPLFWGGICSLETCKH